MSAVAANLRRRSRWWSCVSAGASASGIILLNLPQHYTSSDGFIVAGMVGGVLSVGVAFIHDSVYSHSIRKRLSRFCREQVARSVQRRARLS
jgi:drug/metabolite transporter (DMT)-like permease